MADVKIISKAEAMKITRDKSTPFSISFIVRSGERISIKYALRTKLPFKFQKKEKHFVCVQDQERPSQHPYAVFIPAIETINNYHVAI